MTAFNIFIWSQVCDFHPLAEGSKRIQSFLVLGGVTHHGVVAASSLQQGVNTRGRGDRSKWTTKHSSATETPKLGLFCASKPNWTSETKNLSDILCLGSSAEIWFSHRVWCCPLSGCPVHSAGPAWSAAWSDSPTGIRGNKGKRN